MHRVWFGLAAVLLVITIVLAVTEGVGRPKSDRPRCPLEGLDGVHAAQTYAALDNLSRLREFDTADAGQLLHWIMLSPPYVVDDCPTLRVPDRPEPRLTTTEVEGLVDRLARRLLVQPSPYRVSFSTIECPAGTTACFAEPVYSADFGTLHFDPEFVTAVAVLHEFAHLLSYAERGLHRHDRQWAYAFAAVIQTAGRWTSRSCPFLDRADIRPPQCSARSSRPVE